MDFDGFDWDDGNREKCRKHGVSHEEIEFVLGHGAYAPDLTHSGSEQRYIAVGRNAAKRPIFVAFTVRFRGGVVLARPVSARYMHAREALRYGR